MLSEKEQNVINVIGRDTALTQRGLAEALGFSLGMTNLLLRKLAKTGYLKTIHLNKKKLEYILTPKGITEKVRKSYDYTSRTILEFSLIKKTIQTEVLKAFASGEKRFILVGQNELAEVTWQAVKDLAMPEIALERAPSLEKVNGQPGILLMAAVLPGMSPAGNPARAARTIHILDLLNQNGLGSGLKKVSLQ